ncbi:MAG TPA: isoprenylcysteine carboxylmethyltransferase family protein [Thermoanaerobaculia bacterium]|jgi:protein-S-isoprenylcysteine O-methyltransferase Ste14|nr:isoprenylcysteine carboxylmethyltransferase family protein [Thermoanaerobaculia bacterium]
MAEVMQVEGVAAGGLARKRTGRRRFYRWRVPSAYAVGLLAFGLARPTHWSLLLALGFILPGQALRLWASGHIEKTRCLATGGPYRHTQHPLYLGTCLIALGVAVAAARFSVLLAVGAYLAAFFPYVIRSERDFLHRSFGREYERWTAEVPQFLPRLFPAGDPGTRFAWRRVLSNREWQACLAPPAALALYQVKESLMAFL